MPLIITDKDVESRLFKTKHITKDYIYTEDVEELKGIDLKEELMEEKVKNFLRSLDDKQLGQLARISSKRNLDLAISLEILRRDGR